MNILFLTISYSQDSHVSFYEDLLQEFVAHGHEVHVACASERRDCVRTCRSNVRGIDVLRIRTGNLTGDVGIVEKGMATIGVDGRFKRAIARYFEGIVFDLIIYPTPPITLAGTVEYLKRKTGAATYLLLKDIFPQNAVDLGMMPRSGIKSAVYRFFRKKERRLYRVSDYIGCMSPANVSYLLEHNEGIDSSIVEVCPNCIKPRSYGALSVQASSMLKGRYGIPEEGTVFLYGGNLGRPQGIGFVLDCLRSCSHQKGAFFLIVGGGSEADRIRRFISDNEISNAAIIDSLPKEEYELMANLCDVGLVFLDHRFTIPNFPSRMLSYLQAGLPVIVCSDPCTDMGDIAEENGFGWKCSSDDSRQFACIVAGAMIANLAEMGMRGRRFLEENYDVRKGYEIIMAHFA